MEIKYYLFLNHEDTNLKGSQRVLSAALWLGVFVVLFILDMDQGRY
jgi:hypothetical protein